MMHTDDCGYHLDQYPFECTCGVYAPMDKNLAEVLRVALTGVVTPEDKEAMRKAQRQSWARQDMD